MSLNPTSLISGENGRPRPVSVATIADANHTLQDFAVKVTALLGQDMCLKERRIAQPGLGQMGTAAEPVVLKFRPATAQTEFAIGPTMMLNLIMS